MSCYIIPEHLLCPFSVTSQVFRKLECDTGWSSKKHSSHAMLWLAWVRSTIHLFKSPNDNYRFVAILERETPLQDPGHFLELLASSQGRRLDDQRVSMSHFPGLKLSTSNPPRTLSTSSTDQVPTQGGDIWCTAHFCYLALSISLLTSWLMLFSLFSSHLQYRNASHTLPIQAYRGQRWPAWGGWCLLWHASEVPGKNKIQYSACCLRHSE